MTTTLRSDIARTGAPNPRLDARKVAIIATFGFLLWFIGIFEIRWAGAAGVLSNGFTPLVYALIAVVTIPFIWITPRVVHLPRAYRIQCGSIMGGTAALLDGMAVRWTHWYASDPHLLADSAATLLWAIGVVVALGFAMSVLGNEPDHGTRSLSAFLSCVRFTTARSCSVLNLQTSPPAAAAGGLRLRIPLTRCNH